MRPAATSSLESERQFLFWHALVRDVAYAELPRAARATKHRDAGAWLEEQAGDRVEEFSSVLAHHFTTALDLARAVDDETLAAELLGPTVRFLSLAGDRTLLLDVDGASRQWARALELIPRRNAERPWLLARYAIVLDMLGRTEESIRAFEEAVSGLRKLGDLRRAAYVLTFLMTLLHDIGRKEAEDRCREALALLEGDGPSRELVWVLYNACVYHSSDGDVRLARELGQRAFETATELGLSPRSTESGFNMYRGALMAHGLSRCRLGDAGGLADLRDVSETERELGYTGPFTLNYAVILSMVEGAPQALRVYESAREDFLRYGRRTSALHALSGIFETLCAAGAWDRALAEAKGLVDQLEDVGHLADLYTVQTWRAMVLLRRGEHERVASLVEPVLQARPEIQVPGAVTLCAHIASLRAGGSLVQGRVALGRAFEEAMGRSPFYEISMLPEVLRAAKEVGSERFLRSLCEWIEPVLPVPRTTLDYGEALLAELQGRWEEAAAAFAAAAQSWRDFGVPYEEAQSLLGDGRCLLALDRAPEAAPALERARVLFTELGARPTLAEVDRLLGETNAEAH